MLVVTMVRSRALHVDAVVTAQHVLADIVPELHLICGS
jgi:hypothetical protein